MRRVCAAVAAAIVLAACTLAGEQEVESEEPTAGEGTSEAVIASREVLGDPMLRLAEAVIALADGVGAARHELPRGTQMQQQVNRLADLRAAVIDAATKASDAAAEAPVEQAAAIVEEAAHHGESAAAAARGEIAYLRRLAAIDETLLDAAAEWDRPGSQSEIRARLDALDGKVASLRRALRKTAPRPRQCVAMKRNRAEWIRTVRERTQTLQAQANSAGGTKFDRLRSSYRALPLGVEPRTADRADRRCWAQHSRVAGSAEAMREAVDRLREALSR